MSPLENQAGEFLGYTFWCPGCKGHHVYYLENHHLCWKFDGSMDAPSFTPSLLMRWKAWETGEPVSKVCHLFITKGEIRYCGDCTHELAGKTVPMEPGDW